MREKTITRTFIITYVKVSLYNKDTKQMETPILKAVDVDKTDIEKWSQRQYRGFNVVVLEAEIVSRNEVKYSMSVDQFIAYAEEV